MTIPLFPRTAARSLKLRLHSDVLSGLVQECS